MVGVENNQQRVDTILNGRSPHFAFSYPADPVTTRQVTVNSASEFNTEAQVAGTQITVGSSFTGNINIPANDIDVLMDNSLTINGGLGSFSAMGDRVRWTGGNIGSIEINGANDWLLGDVFVLADSSTRFLNYPQNRIGAAGICNRFFALNCTFRIESNPGDLAWWAMGVYGLGAGGARCDTVFFGNVLFDGNQYAQTTRTEGCNRYMAVDCVYSPNLAVSNGARWHETTDLWLKDGWVNGQMLHSTTASSLPPSVTNALLDGFDSYNSGVWASTDATNTGEIRNSTTYGGSFSIPPYVDGGGNVQTTWDGVTLPDYSNVGAIRS